MSISRHREAKRWLEGPPENWRSVPLRQLAEITYGFPADSAYFTNDPGTIPLIRIRDITSGKSETNYKGTYPKEAVIDDGDVLIGMDGDFNLRIWSGGRALLNQRCCRVAGKDPIITKYLSYALPCALSPIHDLTLSTTVKHLLADGLEGTLLPIPTSRFELMQIVNLLETETAKIDQAMSLLRRELETLEQVKKSMIHEAVTKGLDHTVPMKSSGVEWIGDIPEHWEAKKLKFVASFGSGTTPDSGDYSYYDNGGIPWIQSGDLYRKPRITRTEKTVTAKAIRELSALTVYRAPFVVVAMYGASVGNTSLSEIDACLNQACCYIRGNHRTKNEYSFYAISSARSDLISKAQGGTQPNISQFVLKNQVIPIPPISEQGEIIRYLRAKCSFLDRAAKLKQNQMDILANQRKSLIFEYVTGKRRVNEVA